MQQKLFEDVVTPPPPSVCIEAELPASPPPLSYRMGKGEEEEAAGSSASAQEKGGDGGPSHLQTVSALTNTTFLCSSSSC